MGQRGEFRSSGVKARAGCWSATPAIPSTLPATWDLVPSGKPQCPCDVPSMALALAALSVCVVTASQRGAAGGHGGRGQCPALWGEARVWRGVRQGLGAEHWVPCEARAKCWVLSQLPLDSCCRTMPSACCSPAGSSPTAT